jgi:hypothetical protein
MKVGKKELSNVWTIFLNIFENLKNHHGNTIYQKNYFIFEINSYAFKVGTTKFS